MQKKQSLWKALLFSALICLGGAIIWGLVYSVGFMVYIVAFGTAFFAGAIFVKFYKFNVGAFFWIALWGVLFNEIAVFVVLNLEIVNNVMPELSFARGWDVLFEVIATNNEVKSAIISDSLFNIFCVFIGAAAVWINIVTQKKRQQHINVVANTQPNEIKSTPIVHKTTGKSDFDIFYDKIKAEFGKVAAAFKENKDKDLFKNNIMTLKNKYINKLNDGDKNMIKSRIEAEMQSELNKDVKVTLSTIIKVL